MASCESEEEFDFDDLIKLFDLPVAFTGSNETSSNDGITQKSYELEHLQSSSNDETAEIELKNLKELCKKRKSEVRLVDYRKFPWHFKKNKGIITKSMDVDKPDSDLESGSDSDCIILDNLQVPSEPNINKLKEIEEKKNKALSLKNKTKIDFKRNIGLVGLTIKHKDVIKIATSEEDKVKGINQNEKEPVTESKKTVCETETKQPEKPILNKQTQHKNNVDDIKICSIPKTLPNVTEQNTTEDISKVTISKDLNEIGTKYTSDNVKVNERNKSCSRILPSVPISLKVQLNKLNIKVDKNIGVKDMSKNSNPSSDSITTHQQKEKIIKKRGKIKKINDNKKHIAKKKDVKNKISNPKQKTPTKKGQSNKIAKPNRNVVCQQWKYSNSQSKVNIRVKSPTSINYNPNPFYYNHYEAVPSCQISHQTKTLPLNKSNIVQKHDQPDNLQPFGANKVNKPKPSSSNLPFDQTQQPVQKPPNKSKQHIADNKIDRPITKNQPNTVFSNERAVPPTSTPITQHNQVYNIPTIQTVNHFRAYNIMNRPYYTLPRIHTDIDFTKDGAPANNTGIILPPNPLLHPKPHNDISQQNTTLKVLPQNRDILYTNVLPKPVGYLSAQHSSLVTPHAPQPLAGTFIPRIADAPLKLTPVPQLIDTTVPPPMYNINHAAFKPPPPVFSRNNSSINTCSNSSFAGFNRVETEMQILHGQDQRSFIHGNPNPVNDLQPVKEALYPCLPPMQPLVTGNRNIQVSQGTNKVENEPKTTDYSPPILPIPTYVHLLDKMLTNPVTNTNHSPKYLKYNIKSHTHDAHKINNHNPLQDMKKHETKKISVQEYRKRISHQIDSSYKPHESRHDEPKKPNDNQSVKLEHNYTLRSSGDTDLGYDSDSTVIL